MVVLPQRWRASGISRRVLTVSGTALAAGSSHRGLSGNQGFWRDNGPGNRRLVVDQVEDEG